MGTCPWSTWANLQAGASPAHATLIIGGGLRQSDVSSGVCNWVSDSGPYRVQQLRTHASPPSHDLIFKGVRLRPLSGAPRLVEDRGPPAATKAQMHLEAAKYVQKSS